MQKAEKIAVKTYCNIISGNIGKELVLLDGKKKEKAALVKLCREDFIDALNQFPNRTLVACIRYDIAVKYGSAMASMNNPVEKLKEEGCLFKDDEIGSRIVSYSGFNEEETDKYDFYKDHLLNEKDTQGLINQKTKIMPSPDIEKEIKDWEESMDTKKNGYNDNKRYYTKSISSENGDNINNSSNELVNGN